MTTTINNSNGNGTAAHRKTLSSQLDRLDSILDALAVLRATLAPEPAPVPPPPPPAPQPSRSGGLGSWLWRKATQACAAVCQGARKVASTVKQALGMAMPYKKPLLVAAGVGTGV